jgi:hypothetical protein
MEGVNGREKNRTISCENSYNRKFLREKVVGEAISFANGETPLQEEELCLLLSLLWLFGIFFIN